MTYWFICNIDLLYVHQRFLTLYARKIKALVFLNILFINTKMIGRLSTFNRAFFTAHTNHLIFFFDLIHASYKLIVRINCNVLKCFLVFINLNFSQSRSLEHFLHLYLSILWQFRFCLFVKILLMIVTKNYPFIWKRTIIYGINHTYLLLWRKCT